MNLNAHDEHLRFEASRVYLDQMNELGSEASLEIGYDPKELYDYIKDNWPDKHITGLLILLLDLAPDDVV